MDALDSVRVSARSWQGDSSTDETMAIFRLIQLLADYLIEERAQDDLEQADIRSHDSDPLAH